MRRVLSSIVLGSLVISPSILVAATLLYDNFDGTTVSSSNWHIPTWVSSTDGTFVGRTQFRVTQHSPLPAISEDKAIITVESYNPTGFSFYGTDLISNQSFIMDEGIHVTVRAKMDNYMPGVVGGIFLYALKPGSTTLHDEIDFELLTNLADRVQTNIYSNEPLGIGHPEFVSYASGLISDYHTYEIKWQSTQVSWIIDGNIVRTETNYVPTGPMEFHLNIWVPGSDWYQAYNPNLQPTSAASSNQIFGMSVDYVSIQSLTPISKSPNIGHIYPLLLLGD